MPSHDPLERALEAREADPVISAMFLCLAEIDDLGGGADEWDQEPFCNAGVLFATLGVEIDGDPGIGVAALPLASKRLGELAEEERRENEGGAAGRAVKRLAVEVKMGHWPIDLRRLIELDAMPLGLGYAAEAWAVQPTLGESSHRPPDWAATHPARQEIRFVYLVMYSGDELDYTRPRGREPELRFARPGDEPIRGGAIATGMRSMGRRVLARQMTETTPN